jgi:coenzyme PQQ precursor peptide PqqA
VSGLVASAKALRLRILDKNSVDGGFDCNSMAHSVEGRSIHIFWEACMSWKKPKVTEVCVGMEINDYFPAEL